MGDGKSNQLSGMAKAPRHPLIFCPSKFSAACPWPGQLLLVLLAVLSAVLRSVFAASQHPPHPHHGRKLAVIAYAALLLMTGGNARAQGTVETDRAALVALYNATEGANWTDNTNWLSNQVLSAWDGITTDTDGRVTELLFYNNQLTGSIPTKLGQLTHLESLNLNNNQLTGTIPTELGQLTGSSRPWGN